MPMNCSVARSSRRDPGRGRPRPRPTRNEPLSLTVLTFFNRQRTRKVNLLWLQGVAEAVLTRLGCAAEVGIHLVGAREMARVNWQFLRHEGSTDVITFDHGSTADRLHGEMFISVADAVAQAREFGTMWRGELARYVIHGLLHLHGHDDLEPEKRRRMKRVEERLLAASGAPAVRRKAAARKRAGRVK